MPELSRASSQPATLTLIFRRPLHSYWPGLLRRTLLMLFFCCLVAAFTTALRPEYGFLHQLVYAVCVGSLIGLTVETGRLLTPLEQREYHAESGDHGWPKSWRRNLALTISGNAVGFLGGMPLAAWLLGEPHSLTAMPGEVMLSLLIAVIAGTVGIFYFSSRGKQAALRAHVATAERDATAARLMLLQSQLEPHMLFNTLANLRTLIASDPAAAQHMLDRLNDFLRATFGASRVVWHPLAAEFDRLHDYLALMQIRMGPRLAFALDLPDGLRDQPVPPLLLQPLAENAIRHGLEPRVEGGRIDISAAREGGTLTLTVRDSGVGFDASAPARIFHRGDTQRARQRDAMGVECFCQVQTGSASDNGFSLCASWQKHGQGEISGPGAASQFGLTQVIERVASAYDGQGRVEVQSAPGTGTLIRITVPCLPQPGSGG
ncbi:MAG: histidine kinase [Burkholderiaceae bacterium]|jgi:signal transduction histidine kinase|nr:histidine kinase [Burkholderiaceae bacterium]